MMMLRSVLFLVGLTLGLTQASLARERTISRQAARKLVQAALPALGEDPKYMQIVLHKDHSAMKFYSFSAFRAGSGVLHIYYFSVNPWTGDVWDPAACERLTTPELKSEQDAIWQRSGIPSEARQELQNRSPRECSVGGSPSRLGKD